MLKLLGTRWETVTEFAGYHHNDLSASVIARLLLLNQLPPLTTFIHQHYSLGKLAGILSLKNVSYPMNMFIFRVRLGLTSCQCVSTPGKVVLWSRQN